MKHIYVNTYLHPLLLAVARSPKTWLFSEGEPWLYLSPGRLSRLANRLGLADCRIDALLYLIRRHAPDPGSYCRALGLKRVRQYHPREYPLELCVGCGGVHFPHPEDVNLPCPDCEAELQRRQKGIAGGAARDRRQDKRARHRLSTKDPRSFDGEALSPNWKINYRRRLHRDWEQAINRILMGCAYRTVARDFNCSVGLLHKKVQERKFWENN